MHLEGQPFPYMVILSPNHQWTMDTQNYRLHTLHKWHIHSNSFPSGDTAKSFLTFRRYNVSWALQISQNVVTNADFLMQLHCHVQCEIKIPQNNVLFLNRQYPSLIHNINVFVEILIYQSTIYICVSDWTRGLSGYRARRRVADSRGPAPVACLSLN